MRRPVTAAEVTPCAASGRAGRSNASAPRIIGAAAGNRFITLFSMTVASEGRIVGRHKNDPPRRDRQSAPGRPASPFGHEPVTPAATRRSEARGGGREGRGAEQGRRPGGGGGRPTGGG